MCKLWFFAQKFSIFHSNSFIKDSVISIISSNCFSLEFSFFRLWLDAVFKTHIYLKFMNKNWLITNNKYKHTYTNVKNEMHLIYTIFDRFNTPICDYRLNFTLQFIRFLILFLPIFWDQISNSKFVFNCPSIHLILCLFSPSHFRPNPAKINFTLHFVET